MAMPFALRSLLAPDLERPISFFWSRMISWCLVGSSGSGFRHGRLSFMATGFFGFLQVGV
jgi:hypothetical protein